MGPHEGDRAVVFAPILASPDTMLALGESEEALEVKICSERSDKAEEEGEICLHHPKTYSYSSSMDESIANAEVTSNQGFRLRLVRCMYVCTYVTGYPYPMTIKWVPACASGDGAMVKLWGEGQRPHFP